MTSPTTDSRLVQRTILICLDDRQIVIEDAGAEGTVGLRVIDADDDHQLAEVLLSPTEFRAVAAALKATADDVDRG